MDEIASSLPVFRVMQALTGANQSTEYHAELTYQSLVNPEKDTIRVEVGVREPHLTTPGLEASNTLVLNPITGRPLVDAHVVRCLSWHEMMAEKLRAALCRREVAIRDFFDIDDVVRSGRLNTRDETILTLLQNKLRVPDTDPVDVSSDRMDRLPRQLQAELRPVLRQKDFVQFDLHRAMAVVRDVAEAVRRLG